MSNRAKFAAVFVVVNLHLLRNLAGLPYLALYAAVASWVTLSFLASPRRKGFDLKVPGVWVAGAAFALGVSSLTIGAPGAAYGAARFLFVAPVFMAFVQYTDDESDLRAHISTMVTFFCVAALTVPLQFATGPIGWFAMESERGGFERYGSLAGSLTSLGIAAGSYLVLVQIVRRGKLMRVAAIVTGALASLSKAAIANVAIAALLGLWNNRKNAGRGLAALLIAGAASALAVAYVPDVSDRFDSSLQSFGFSVEPGQQANFDDSIAESAIDRLTKLPRDNYAALADLGSPFVYVTGGGYGMASTALVRAQDSAAPMAHNQYSELITVFGPIVGAAMLGGLCWICVTTVRLAKQFNLAGVVASSYILLLMNGLFANGILYQPASASILCLAAFVSCAGPRLLGQPCRSYQRSSVIPSSVALRIHSTYLETPKGPSESLSGPRRLAQDGPIFE